MGSTGENVAPSFVKKPQLRQEDDGNRLIFECKLAGSPQPEVVWFREDVRIVDDNRTSIRVVEDGKNQYSVILELNDVVETDAGLYKVKAKNKYGEVSASINLNFSPVDAPPQPQVDGTAPTFSKKPTIRQEDDGNTLVFHCAIVADPLPQITWYHNGVKVQDTLKYQVVTKEENQYTFDSSLIMRNVTVEDAGKYKVTARNDLGESNATISLNFDSDEAAIPTGGVKPTFTERPVIRQSDEGTKIIFQCRLAGEPKPSLTWYHGEKVVTESARVKMTMKLDKKMYYLCCLEISNVEAGDAGQYKAVAKNASGESQATINLTFEESGAAGKPKIPDGVAPRFPNKPTIRQEGDNLVMECQLEAHPMPEITWYRADKRVEENSRIRYECKNVGKHKMMLTLTITNPSMADGGLYRCNAFNPFGDSNANIDLNFETGDGEAGQPGPPQPAVVAEKKASTASEPAKPPQDGFPPTFTEKPRIVPNESGTLVTMKFKVRSKPKAEMQWFKGSQKIKEGPKFAVKYNTLANDEYEIMLEIAKPCGDDGGDYKCMMKNEFGQLQAKLNLNIEAEPAPAATPAGQAPTFMEKPKPKSQKKKEKKVKENVDKSIVKTGGAIPRSIPAATGPPVQHPVKGLEAALSHLDLAQPPPVLKGRTPDFDAEQEVINISIAEKEALLEELRKHAENIIESKAKEMSKLIAGAEAAEDEKSRRMKEIADVGVRIRELQTNEARLVKEVEEQESTLNKLNKKRKKLEYFIATDISETKTNMEKLEGEIESLKSSMIKHTQGSPKKPTVEPPVPPNLQLLEFINNKIEVKEKELECPVCLDVASVPIYMCDELHLICSNCRPKVSTCPECREPYPGRPRRHRYAERAAEELAGLRGERAAISGEPAA